MQITPVNNKDKLEKHYGIGQVPSEDINLLNIFELLTILKDVSDKITTNLISRNQQITFSEFYVVCFLLQQISNNFGSLSDEYLQKEELKEITKIITQDYEWRAADRLSSAHVINLFQGAINNFQLDERIYEITKQLSITNDNNTKRNLSKDNFDQLLSFNFIFFEEILKKQSNEDLFSNREFEAKILYTFINQVSSNCLSSIARCPDNQKEYFKIRSNFNPVDPNLSPNDKLKYIIPMRNHTAHGKTLEPLDRAYSTIGNYYQVLQNFLHTGTNKEYYNNCLKEIEQFNILSAVTLTEIKDIQEEQRIVQQQTKKTSIKPKQQKDIKSEQQSINRLLEYFNTLSPPEYQSILDSQGITYRIIDIIKDYYNNKQPISPQDIIKLKNLINHENFNADISIICQYKSPLPRLSEYEKNSRKYDHNHMIQIFKNDEKKPTSRGERFIRHRPIDILCQIASTKDEVELIESMIQTANLTLRNNKDFSLVDYALINPKLITLEKILQNIPINPESLLLKIMDGSIKGTIEEGYKINQEITCPLLLAIRLKKEKHAIMLLQYDKEYDQRVGQQEMFLNTKHGLKQETLIFDTMLLGLYNELFDFIGELFTKKQSHIDKICTVPKELSGILKLWAEEDKNQAEQNIETLLTILIKHEVDISKIPILRTNEEGDIVQDNLLARYIANLGIEYKATYKKLARIVPIEPGKLEKIVSDPELFDICNDVRKIKVTIHENLHKTQNKEKSQVVTQKPNQCPIANLKRF